MNFEVMTFYGEKEITKFFNFGFGLGLLLVAGQCSLPFSVVDGSVNLLQILVLIWYWFVNFLCVNLFCNFY